MSREDTLKRLLSLLPEFIGLLSLSVIFIAVGALLSMILFLKTFRLDVSLPAIKHKKEKIIKRDYSGLDRFFLNRSVSYGSLSGNTVKPPVNVASGKVMGIIVAGKDRFLVVSQGTDFKILKEGDTLNGEKIVKISSLYYQLSDGRRVYLISSGGQGIKQNFTGSSSFPPERKGEEKVIKLDRTMVERETADIGKLLKDVNIVPVLRHGETIGYRFLRIRPGTILTKIGFRNGDIVTAVNDMPVRTVEDAFKIYNMLRNEDTVKVEIERHGRKEVIIYEIR